MKILSTKSLKRFLRRGVQPFMNEVKAGLCAFNLGEHTFPVDDFADVRFRCSSLREIKLTSDFGYEKSALGTFLFLLTPGDVVWDVGAAFGLFSVHSAEFCNQVVAFEPDPSHYQRLVGNIELNRQGSKVSIQQLALCDSQGELSLSTSGLSGVSPTLGVNDKHSSKVSVKTETVDRMVKSGVVKPTVMKIDVEGAEAQVLRGAAELLSSEEKPRLLFIEVHPEFLGSFGDSAEDLEHMLIATGYRLLASDRRKGQYHLLAVPALESANGANV